MISLSGILFSERVATRDLICVFSSYVNLDNITTYTYYKDKLTYFLMHYFLSCVMLLPSGITQRPSTLDQ